MLRRAVSRAPAVPRRNLVVLAVRDRRFAVPADRVVEVARIAGYTPVPCDDPSNLGVLVHRGGLVPLVDAGAHLGLRPAAPRALPGLCVFVRAHFGEVGVPIDQVLGLEPAVDGALPEGVILLDPGVLGGRVGEHPQASGGHRAGLPGPSRRS